MDRPNSVPNTKYEADITVKMTRGDVVVETVRHMTPDLLLVFDVCAPMQDAVETALGLVGLGHLLTAWYDDICPTSYAGVLSSTYVVRLRCAQVSRV